MLKKRVTVYTSKWMTSGVTSGGAELPFAGRRGRCDAVPARTVLPRA